METALSLVASFLGGALIASVGFMGAFVTRLTRVETTLASLCKRFDTLKENRDVCSLHNEMDKRLAVAESKIKEVRHSQTT